MLNNLNISKQFLGTSGLVSCPILSWSKISCRVLLWDVDICVTSVFQAVGFGSCDRNVSCAGCEFGHNITYHNLLLDAGKLGVHCTCQFQKRTGHSMQIMQYIIVYTILKEYPEIMSRIFGRDAPACPACGVKIFTANANVSLDSTSRKLLQVPMRLCTKAPKGLRI